MGNTGQIALERRTQPRPSETPDVPFWVELRPDRERVAVVPHGELDLATVGAVRAGIDELIMRGFHGIVIDLRWTSFIDSTGLCLMLTTTAREDAVVTFIDGPERVSRVFDLAGIRHVLTFEPSP
jgi:anti-anti-sigma factor